MKRCIVSYYPSDNKIHNIYNSVEEAKKDVMMCNILGFGDRLGMNLEKLAIGEAELTDEEYRELMGE